MHCSTPLPNFMASTCVTKTTKGHGESQDWGPKEQLQHVSSGNFTIREFMFKLAIINLKK